MADETGKDGSSTNTTRTRKLRPEIQIYRPGMMRKGTDVTASGPPPNDCKPPSEPPRQKRPSRISLENSRGGARAYETTSRRRSNDTESVHSYCGDSGSTTPDAASMCSDRRDSFGRGSGMRTYSRGGGYSNNKQIYNSNHHEFTSSPSSSKRGARDGGGRPNYRMSPGQGNRDGVNDRVPSPRYSYNSTQSLYDPQQPEGYLGYRQNFSSRGRGGKTDIGRAPSPVRFKRTAQIQKNERASMRAEGGQRRNVGNRRRNDSITSTQSECLPPPSDRLNVDTSAETRSVAGDAPQSPSMSYMQLCQSFESIGSFDWSREVESEYNAKHGEEKDEHSMNHQDRGDSQDLHNGSPQKEFTYGEGPHSNYSMRGILRIPPSFRNDRGRNRNDSDRSSLRGSIVEEEFDESCEPSSGECTPTEESGDEKHWSNRRAPPMTKLRSDGYSGGDDIHKENRGGRLFGRVTVDRSRRENNSSEAKPLAARSTRILLRNEPRTYKPPAMRMAERNDTAAPSGVVRNSEEMPVGSASPSSQPRQMTDYPVYREIAKNQGPKMQKINDSITSLLTKVQQRDVAAAEKIVQLSGDLCEIYYDVMLRDIVFTFSMNLEQHLWKQAFYKPIEVFKTMANSPKDSSRTFRAQLLVLINKGIVFYERLIALYEKELDVDVQKAALFQFERDENFWDVCLSPNTPDAESSRRKIALKSCSRHLISLGDLKRYRTLVEGSEDYSGSRTLYLRSAQLWPASGHCYNQLAVVAYFSMLYRSRRRARNTPLEILSNKRQGHALDEIFFCIRALSAGHPFETARDRLHARLAAMKRKVDKYEPLLDIECGEVREDAELAASADRPYEIWLDTEGANIEADNDVNVFRSFLDQQPSKLHRRAISYVINTVGLLITKIGMETFPSVSDRAIAQLAALVEQEDSPVTAQQLVQIAALFIYAVHCNGIAGDEDVCSVQQQQAVHALVSVFGVFLRPVALRVGEVHSWTKGSSEVPKVVTRVLPAVCVLCEWFSCPLASAIYRTMPSVEPLPTSIVDIDTWHLLANIANELARLQDGGEMVKIETSAASAKTCILPELAYLSSFSNVFPSFPRVLRFADATTETPDTFIPLQIRLAQLLLAAEYLDGSDLSCFFFCEKTGRFRRSEHVEGDLRERSKAPYAQQFEESPRVSTPLTREELLEREMRKHEQLLVVSATVKPVYLVIDTNAFIDQLSAIQKILQCERFRVLIPTTVMEELIDLQHGELSNPRVQGATEGARQAVTWLREQTRQKNPRLFTLTMRGRRLPIAVVREEAGDDGELVNDDRILRSCVNYTQLEPAPESLFSDVKVPQGREMPNIYRNLVLLTEDRVLNMKAMCQHIPCRTMVRFMKWAKIS
uniref:Telomerase activating protein Est1 domain containing protein n=1 Tax=Haemonchus contortus TaxID=6289 RepID=W6NCE7_HAECO